MNSTILQRFDLEGRTVAITGGGGALCGAMADALGAMGAKVAVLDLSLTEQLRFLHIDSRTGELLPRARQVIAHTPMGRYGQPDDLIGALVWLLSDASS